MRENFKITNQMDKEKKLMENFNLLVNFPMVKCKMEL